MSLQVTWALCSATWREKLSHPVLVVLYGLLCFVYTTVAVSLSHDLADPVLYLTVLVAAGSVGREVSSGVLPLLFTRPITRTTYVVAKWLAISLAAAALAAVTLLLQALLLARGGQGVAAADVGAAVFQSATTAFGVSSLLIFFSVLMRGAGDVAVWLALVLIESLARGRLPLRVVEEWHAVLFPKLAWGATMFSVFSYLSTVTLCLCLAALAVNRKELSYATG